MNDSQVKQQINQMVSFIRQEADEKANEIRVKAEEDFNIRKLSAVESAREKIREEYERKMKQIHVKEKIAYSMANNESRLMVLKVKEGLLRSVYDEVSVGPFSTEQTGPPHCADGAVEPEQSADEDDHLATFCLYFLRNLLVPRKSLEQLRVASSDPKKLGSMLEHFALQGLLMFNDHEVALITREADRATLKPLLPKIAAAYEQKTGRKVILGLSESESLPADSIGGVVLSSNEGRIRLENTIESRLELAYQQNLPYLREKLGFNLV